MDIRNRRALKQAAAQRLENASCDPGRLILVHTLITIAVNILSLVITEWLDTRIAETGGLAGMGARTTLATIQTLVSYLPMIVAIFWNAGYVFSLMNLFRGRNAGLDTMAEGFRRFGPVLRYTLVWFLLYMGVGMGATFLAMLIFFSTPLFQPLLELTTAGMEAGTISADGTILDPALESAILDATLPAMLVILVILLAALWFLSYYFRLGLYALLDDKMGRAFAAMGTSFRLMRGNKAALFRLDLSFWWYYLLLILASALAYLDLFLPMLGITLPVSAETAGYIAYVVYLAALLALYVFAKNRVEGTYILFYEALRDAPAADLTPDSAQ